MGTPKGGYFTADGEKVPSVTTILGRFKESAGLMFWAHKVGMEQGDVIWKNRIGRWGKLCFDESVCAYYDAPMDKLLSESTRTRIEKDIWEPEHESTRLYDVSGKAAAAGTLAHDAIEAFILAKGDRENFEYVWPESDGDTLRKAQNAFEQFIEWFDDTKIELLDPEFGSVSEKYRFGGTLDAIGRDSKGRTVLLDWKTSNAIYSDYLLQLAAYAILLEENKGIKVERCHIVRVAKESADFAHASFGDIEDAKETFLAMAALYPLVEKIKQRVK